MKKVYYIYGIIFLAIAAIASTQRIIEANKYYIQDLASGKKVIMQAPASIGADYTWQLPTSAGSNNQSLISTGTSSYWSTVPDAGLTNSYIYANGTRGLTANWNAGIYNITAGTFNGYLNGNAATSSALFANPTDCGANNFAYSIDASGNLTCSTIPDAALGSTYLYANGTRALSGNWNAGAFNITAGTFTGNVLKLNGSTSGVLTMQAGAATTNYTLNWPTTQGTASTYLKNDGSGNLSWHGIADGANTTLSNLTSPVAVNQDINPSSDWGSALGVSGKAWSQVETGEVILTALSGVYTGEIFVHAPYTQSFTNHDFILPPTVGNNNDVLTSNGAGGTSWTTLATGGTFSLANMYNVKQFTSDQTSFSAGYQANSLANGIGSVQNTLIGNLTGGTSLLGDGNTALGYQALNGASTNVTYNTALGAQALLNATTNANIAIGYHAGTGITGGQNILIGYQAGQNMNGGFNTVLGPVTVPASTFNSVYIGDGAGNPKLTIDAAGQAGIGTTTPQYKLDVFGSGRMTGNITAGTYFTGSYSSGSILFSDGSKIAQDNSNLFWDNTNKRFGIGTTSPDRGIVVKGSSFNGQIVAERTDNASAALQLRSSNAGGQSVSGVGLGAVAFYGRDNVSSFQQGAYIQAISTENITSTQAGSALQFATAGAGTLTLTERMRIDSSGNVGIGLTPTARNNTRLQIVDGIGFPATQVPSSDANTLDDYKEGTFTPSAASTAGTITSFGTLSATYTKIGNLVTVSVNVVITNNGTGSGAIRVSNMPYTAYNQLDQHGAGREQTAVGTPLNCYIAGNTTNLYIFRYDGTYPGGTGYTVSCTLTYRVN